MPGKNKPKRLDRNRGIRVARRKKKVRDVVNGTSRNRKPRPKHKGAVVEKVEVVKLEKKVEKKAVKKKE